MLIITIIFTIIYMQSASFAVMPGLIHSTFTHQVEKRNIVWNSTSCVTAMLIVLMDKMKTGVVRILCAIITVTGLILTRSFRSTIIIVKQEFIRLLVGLSVAVNLY
jgi:hypothetical protein